MKKHLLFSFLFLCLTISANAQIQKGSFVPFGTAATYGIYSDISRYEGNGFNITPSFGYFLSDKWLIGSRSNYGYAQTDIYNKPFIFGNGDVIDNYQEGKKENLTQVFARYYLPQNNRNRFFVEANLFRNAGNIEYIDNNDNLPFWRNENKFFGGSLVFGTNRKLRKEMYLEGKIEAGLFGFRFLNQPDGGNNDDMAAINITANFVPFAAISSKNVSKAKDVLAKKTKIIGGGAAITNEFFDGGEHYNFKASINPTYLIFVNPHLAVGGSANFELGYIYTDFVPAFSLLPTARYHLWQKGKGSPYAQLGLGMSSSGVEFDNLAFNLRSEIGFNYFVGDGLALSPNIRYAHNNGDNTALHSFSFNIGFQYFIANN